MICRPLSLALVCITANFCTSIPAQENIKTRPHREERVEIVGQINDKDFDRYQNQKLIAKVHRLETENQLLRQELAKTTLSLTSTNRALEELAHRYSILKSENQWLNSRVEDWVRQLEKNETVLDQIQLQIRRQKKGELPVRQRSWLNLTPKTGQEATISQQPIERRPTPIFFR